MVPISPYFHDISVYVGNYGIQMMPIMSIRRFIREYIGFKISVFMDVYAYLYKILTNRNQVIGLPPSIDKVFQVVETYQYLGRVWTCPH